MRGTNDMDDRKYIDEAVNSFRVLLEEQLRRQDEMTKGEACGAEEGHAGKTGKPGPVVIGIAPGDGIGTVIMAEAEKVLRKLLADELDSGKAELRHIGGLTLENRLAKGAAVPKDVLDEIKKCDVLLKGPTTTPKGGSLESANVTLRRELDLFANIRPVQVPEEDINWMFFRENTEGEYVLGSRGIEIPGKLSMDFKVTTDAGTRRIARAAFDYAKGSGKTKVAIVTKANIMKKTDGNFSRICHEVAEDYPGIEADDWYIDIMTANLLNPAVRKDFQVFLMPNLYGDILTDEAAEIQGGVGTAGSANTGERYAMFEAVHGSAPRMVEEGLAEYANPASILKACEMMLRHTGFTDKADALAKALHTCLEKEKAVVVTGTVDGAKAADFGDYVLSKL